MHRQCHLLLSLFSHIVATTVFRLRKIEFDSRELHSLRGGRMGILTHFHSPLSAAACHAIYLFFFKKERKKPIVQFMIGVSVYLL